MHFLCWKSMVTLLSLVDILTIQPFTNLLVPLASAAGLPSIKNWKLQDIILWPFQCLIHFVYSNHVIKQNLCENCIANLFPYLLLPYVRNPLLITNLHWIPEKGVAKVQLAMLHSNFKLEWVKHTQRKKVNFNSRIT